MYQPWSTRMDTETILWCYLDGDSDPRSPEEVPMATKDHAPKVRPGPGTDR